LLQNDFEKFVTKMNGFVHFFDAITTFA